MKYKLNMIKNMKKNSQQIMVKGNIILKKKNLYKIILKMKLKQKQINQIMIIKLIKQK